MNSNNKTLLLVFLFCIPLFFAFTVDCWQNYVDDWNATMAKYEKDTARCADAMFPETCQLEPDAILRYERTQNIIAYQRCIR